MARTGQGLEKGTKTLHIILCFMACKYAVFRFRFQVSFWYYYFHVFLFCIFGEFSTYRKNCFLCCISVFFFFKNIIIYVLLLGIPKACREITNRQPILTNAFSIRGETGRDFKGDLTVGRLCFIYLHRTLIRDSRRDTVRVTM